MNNLFKPYAPLWGYKQSLTIKKAGFPILDYNNCGPIISQNNEQSIKDDGEGTAASINFENVKLSSEVFPLEMPNLCAQPLQLESTNNEFTFTSTGEGLHCECISSFTWNNDNYLVYGEKFNKSYVLKVFKLDNNGDISKCNSNIITNFKLLHEVQSVVINNCPFLALRVDESFLYVKINENEFAIESFNDENTYNCSMNKVINGTVALAKHDGTVHMFDMLAKKPIWNQNFMQTENTFNTLRCEFGNHPLQLSVANNNDVWLIDGRISSNRNNKLNNRKLFSLNDCDYLFKNVERRAKELVFSVKHLQDLPYLYVICSECIFLIDSRYCNSPVLQWHHMLQKPLIHPSLIQSKNVNALVLASAVTSDLCIVPTHVGPSECDIKSLNTVKHFNPVKNTQYFMNENDFGFSDDIDKHLNSLMIGCTILPSNSCNYSWDFYYQNHFGTMFRTAITKGHKENDSLGNISHLRSFESNLCKEARANIHKSKCTLKNVAGKWEMNFSKPKNKLMTTTSDSTNIWNINKVKVGIKSSKATYYINGPTDFGKSYPSPLFNYLPNQLHETLSDSYISNCNDPMSQKLISAWGDLRKEEGREKKGLQYRSFPIYLEPGIEVSKLDRNKLLYRHEMLMSNDSTNEPHENNVKIKPTTEINITPSNAGMVDKMTMEKISSIYTSTETKTFTKPINTFSKPKPKKKRSRVDGF